MWQNGAITADYLCWKEGLTYWTPVASIINPVDAEMCAKEDGTLQKQPMTKMHAVKPQKSIQTYTLPELLKIASYRELMANFNVVALILSALVGFAERNTTGNSNETTLIQIGTLLAFPCWILTCYYVYVLMRAMKKGRLGASTCVLLVAFIPFVTLVTTIYIYYLAKRELVNAGVKSGSASFMKNQIRRMNG